MKKPERTWNDPSNPCDTAKLFEKIAGFFTRRSIVYSFGFNWCIWILMMIRAWSSDAHLAPVVVIGTFILITVYAILISPIVEWIWNCIIERKS
jgi:hypothetical protein